MPQSLQKLAKPYSLMGLGGIVKLFLIALAMVCVTSSSQAADWKAFQYLIGDWAGTGNGVPGPSTGTDSFAMDLQSQVILRKSHSDYPEWNGRAAFSQDGLMVMYQDVAGKVKADYYDNENHVINYSVSITKKAWIFLSNPSASVPQFRLTYTPQDDNTMSVLFEIAPPNTPGKFQTYVSGMDQRK